MMDPISLAKYYIENRDEFIGESGHDIIENKILKYAEKNTCKHVIGIDVGSGIGDNIPIITQICSEKNSKILCFEPNPINYNYLKGNIINNYDNVILYKCCISDVIYDGELYNWKDCEYNLKGNGLAGLRSGGKKICDVDIKRLDNILDEEFEDKDIVIKYIKIDTEGNDGNVIKSLGKYLFKTKYIIFECSDCLDDIRGPGINNPMEDIVKFLSSYGFDTYRIGSKKAFKVNDEYWNDVYEKVKFWSNCFSLRKNDGIISQIVDEKFDYI